MKVESCSILSTVSCFAHYLYSFYKGHIPDEVPVQFGLDGSVGLWAPHGSICFALFPFLSAVFPLKNYFGWERINYPFKVALSLRV